MKTVKIINLINYNKVLIYIISELLMKLKINEIYKSIQGESTYMGLPCTFIRLTYCNLRCSYCDSEHSFYEGVHMSISNIMTKIAQWDCKLIEVTGGEPLFQEQCINLLEELIKNKYKVMLETSGSISISQVPKEVIKIVDFKCPSSKMDNKNLWTIIKDLQSHDEVKFVIGNRTDFEWVKDKINKYNIIEKHKVLLSPSFGTIEPELLVKWILSDNLDVRLQLQLHKYIWDPKKTGV